MAIGLIKAYNKTIEKEEIKKEREDIKHALMHQAREESECASHAGG
jgi:hypothetical protein